VTRKIDSEIKWYNQKGTKFYRF